MFSYKIPGEIKISNTSYVVFERIAKPEKWFLYFYDTLFPKRALIFLKKLFSLLQGCCNKFHSAESYHILPYMKNVRQWHNSFHYKQLNVTFHKLNKMFSIKLVGSINYCTLVH